MSAASSPRGALGTGTPGASHTADTWTCTLSELGYWKDRGSDPAPLVQLVNGEGFREDVGR